MTATIAFRFDALNHEYVELATGQILPHITGMLNDAGLIDEQWFTAESCDRGHAVHRLTAQFDEGALTDVDECRSKYRGYLLAHVQAMALIRPEILKVEEPAIHSVYRFGGRPDRIIRLHDRRGVLEIKSGAPEKSHPIQTALQAILDSEEAGIPAEMLGRLALYLKANGRFMLEEHVDRRDFDKAMRIIKRYAR